MVLHRATVFVPGSQTVFTFVAIIVITVIIMHGYALTLVAAATVVKAAQDFTIGASVDGGKTRLFGNSFGRPGYNDTYDYVVSSIDST